MSDQDRDEEFVARRFELLDQVPAPDTWSAEGDSAPSGQRSRTIVMMTCAAAVLALALALGWLVGRQDVAVAPMSPSLPESPATTLIASTAQVTTVPGADAVPTSPPEPVDETIPVPPCDELLGGELPEGTASDQLNYVSSNLDRMLEALQSDRRSRVIDACVANGALALADDAMRCWFECPIAPRETDIFRVTAPVLSSNPLAGSRVTGSAIVALRVADDAGVPDFELGSVEMRARSEFAILEVAPIDPDPNGLTAQGAIELASKYLENLSNGTFKSASDLLNADADVEDRPDLEALSTLGSPRSTLAERLELWCEAQLGCKPPARVVEIRPTSAAGTWEMRFELADGSQVAIQTLRDMERHFVRGLPYL